MPQNPQNPTPRDVQEYFDKRQSRRTVQAVQGVNDYFDQRLERLQKAGPPAAKPATPAAPQEPGLWDIVKGAPKAALDLIQDPKAAVDTVSDWVSSPKHDPQPSQYAKPGPYGTTLAAQEEPQFQQWLQGNQDIEGVREWKDTPTSDYDMRGYWKASQGARPTSVNPNDNKVHFTDQFKTPYHKSFSNESQYALPNAPRWNDQDQLIDQAGNVVYDERAQNAPSLLTKAAQAATRPIWNPTGAPALRNPKAVGEIPELEKKGYAPEDVGPYVPVKSTQNPAYAKKHPVETKLTETVEGLASPLSIGLAAATGGISTIPTVGRGLATAITAGFAGQQLGESGSESDQAAIYEQKAADLDRLYKQQLVLQQQGRLGPEVNPDQTRQERDDAISQAKYHRTGMYVSGTLAAGAGYGATELGLNQAAKFQGPKQAAEQAARQQAANAEAAQMRAQAEAAAPPLAPNEADRQAAYEAATKPNPTATGRVGFKNVPGAPAYTPEGGHPDLQTAYDAIHNRQTGNQQQQQPPRQAAPPPPPPPQQPPQAQQPPQQQAPVQPQAAPPQEAPAPVKKQPFAMPPVPEPVQQPQAQPQQQQADIQAALQREQQVNARIAELFQKPASKAAEPGDTSFEFGAEAQPQTPPDTETIYQKMVEEAAKMRLEQVRNEILTSQYATPSGRTKSVTGTARRAVNPNDPNDISGTEGRIGSVKPTEVTDFPAEPADIVRAIEKGSGKLYSQLVDHVRGLIHDNDGDMIRDFIARDPAKAAELAGLTGPGTLESKSDLFGNAKPLEFGNGSQEPGQKGLDKEVQRQTFAGRRPEQLKEGKAFDTERLENSPLFKNTEANPQQKLFGQPEASGAITAEQLDRANDKRFAAHRKALQGQNTPDADRLKKEYEQADATFQRLRQQWMDQDPKRAQQEKDFEEGTKHPYWKPEKPEGSLFSQTQPQEQGKLALNSRPQPKVVKYVKTDQGNRVDVRPLNQYENGQRALGESVNFRTTARPHEFVPKYPRYEAEGVAPYKRGDVRQREDRPFLEYRNGTNGPVIYMNQKGLTQWKVINGATVTQPGMQGGDYTPGMTSGTAFPLNGDNKRWALNLKYDHQLGWKYPDFTRALGDAMNRAIQDGASSVQMVDAAKLPNVEDKFLFGKDRQPLETIKHTRQHERTHGEQYKLGTGGASLAGVLDWDSFRNNELIKPTLSVADDYFARVYRLKTQPSNSWDVERAQKAKNVFQAEYWTHLGTGQYYRLGLSFEETIKAVAGLTHELVKKHGPEKAAQALSHMAPKVRTGAKEIYERRYNQEFPPTPGAFRRSDNVSRGRGTGQSESGGAGGHLRETGRGGNGKAVQGNVPALRPGQRQGQLFDQTSAQAGGPELLEAKQLTPPQSPEFSYIDRVRKQSQEGPSLFDRLLQAPAELKQRLLDQRVFVRKMVEDAQKRGITVNADKDPGKIMDLVAGGAGGHIEAAKLDYADVKADALKAGLDNYVSKYLDLAGYRRAIDVIREKEATARQAGQTRVADQYARKLANGEVVPAGLTDQRINQLIGDLQNSVTPQEWAKVTALAKRVHDLNRQAWDAAHDAGMISDQVYNQGIRRGPEYIPLERIQDMVNEEGGLSSKLQVKQQKYLKRLEGSVLVNVDPYEASFNKAAIAYKEAQRNRAARTLVDFRNVDPHGIGKFIREAVDNEKPRPGYGTVAVWRDGTKHTYLVPKFMSDAADFMVTKQLDVMDKVLNVGKQILSTGATGANLGFSVPNVIRDIGDARKLLGHAYNPVDAVKFLKTWSDSLTHIIKEDADYREFLRSGAAFSTLQKQLDPKEFLSLKRSMGQKLKLLSGIHSVEKFNNWMEEATKMASRQYLLDRGMNPTEAAWQTRRFGGSPDFALKGQWTNSINLVAMFFNAQMQGIARNLGGLKKSPASKLLVLALVPTVLALLKHAWNAQFVNEDGKPEWDHIANTDKAKNHVLIMPWTVQTSSGEVRHEVVKIPKGHMAQLFYNPIEAAIDAAVGDSGKVAQAGWDLLSSVSPGNVNIKSGKKTRSALMGAASGLNPIIKEVAEQASNHDTYSDTPIVPESKTQLDPELQKRPGTSPTAIKLAEPMGTSPLRVEHLIRNVFAGLGEQYSTLSDSIIGKNRAPAEGSEKLSRYPVAGPVIRRFLGTAGDQVQRDREERFYDLYSKVDESNQSFKKFYEQDPERAKRYLTDDFSRALLIGSTAGSDLQAAAHNMNLIRQAMAEIGAQSIGDDKKKTAIRKLHLGYESILKEAEGQANSLQTLAAKMTPAQKQNFIARVLENQEQ